MTFKKWSNMPNIQWKLFVSQSHLWVVCECGFCPHVELEGRVQLYVWVSLLCTRVSNQKLRGRDKIQQIFTENLLCARHCCRPLRYISEQNRQ